MIQDFADWLVYGLFGLIERLRNYLMTHKMYGLQYLLASIFGAITPFCSCSSIPLFIGFVKGGIPLGVTFAFLITSPLVNEVAVAMFLGTFGLEVTLIYVVSGILLGVIGGFVLGRMKLHPYLSDWVKQIQANSSAQTETWEKDHTPFIKRLPSIVHRSGHRHQHTHSDTRQHLSEPEMGLCHHGLRRGQRKLSGLCRKSGPATAHRFRRSVVRHRYAGFYRLSIQTSPQ